MGGGGRGQRERDGGRDGGVREEGEVVSNLFLYVQSTRTAISG